MTSDLHSDWTVKVLKPLLRHQAREREKMFKDQAAARQHLEEHRAKWERMYSFAQTLKRFASPALEISVGNGDVLTGFSLPITVTLGETGRMQDVEPIIAAMEATGWLQCTSSSDYEGGRMFHFVMDGQHFAAFSPYVAVHTGTSKNCRTVPTGEIERSGWERPKYKVECD